MDNFRKYRAPSRSLRAMDGFVGSGNGSARQRPSARQAEIDSPRQVRVDNFRNSDGFRANTQPIIAASGKQVAPNNNRKSHRADDAKAERLSPADMRLPEAGKRQKKQRRKSTRIALRVVGSLFLLGLLTGGYIIGRTYLAVHGVFKGGGSAPALAKTVDVTKLKGEGDGRINILLLGIGGAGHDGADLTDTIMLASIDPVNNKAALLSIPRDLWVKMPNNFIANEQKINASYESGKYKFLGQQNSSNANHDAINAGFKAVDGVIGDVTGITIHYNVLVDFHAFEQAVDTVGGVTVNVPEDLVDPTMAWDNNRNPVLAKAGLQTFNGHKALNYVRSRETTSDFARAERQRLVMVALKDKVFSLGTLSNPVKISNLINTFGDNVQSDLSVADAARLVDIMKKIDNSKIQSVGLTGDKVNLVTTANIGGLSVVEPKAGLFQYNDIQSYVRNMLKDGFIEKEDANIAVYNGSTIAGLAGKKASDLRSYGYNVVTVANAPKQNFTQTVIVDLSNGQKKVTKHYLEQRFGVTAVSALPEGVNGAGADFVIILGQNESHN